MCGIAGVVNFENINLNIMIQSLQHRGPDAQSIYTNDKVALLHTRLAIQDVKLGKQPFHYQHYSIIFNGEIYNHKELRQHLSEFKFQTASDTETLLYLFIKYQFKMFAMLDGMFAFCIYDKRKQKLIFARDRAGKKPLYYTTHNQRFVFASELNAIKKVIALTINPDAIYAYLRTGFFWGSYTAYQNVQKLEPSTYLILDIETLTVKTGHYFNILEYYDDAAKEKISRNLALEKLDEKLKKSIADRITASDVEVGVFLSGGIDSNLITAIAATLKPNIKTFTVKFSAGFDESALARVTANQYRTEHIELNITAQLKNDIEKILLSYGEPFMDSSAIPTYYISREAAKYVKVVLSGDGADELFAGYRRYVPAAYHLTRYIRLLSPIIKYLPTVKNKQSFYNYLYRLLAMANKTGLEYYLSATTDIFEDILPISQSPVTCALNSFIKDILANPKLTPLNKMLYADYRIILFSDLLVKMDIASMAHSLEVRSPFLSKYLLEFAPRLQDQFKIHQFKTKFILRELSKKYLSSTLINQPKRGFEVPLKKWVDDDLKENIHDSLQSGCLAENYVNRKNIQRILNDRASFSLEKRAKMLWSLYCLETWLRHENSFYC